MLQPVTPPPTMTTCARPGTAPSVVCGLIVTICLQHGIHVGAYLAICLAWRATPVQAARKPRAGWEIAGKLLNDRGSRRGGRASLECRAGRGPGPPAISPDGLFRDKTPENCREAYRRARGCAHTR